MRCLTECGKVWRLAVGGHYVLMADGTFYFFYDFYEFAFGDTLPLRPQGRYVHSDNTIEFYLTEGSFLSRGLIAGDAMHVWYGYSDDDPADEDYARR